MKLLAPFCISKSKELGVKKEQLTGGAAEKNQSQGAKGDDLGSLHDVGCLGPARRTFMSGS